MNDLRKAAEMALEALETTWGNGSEGTLKQWEETIQALRQALAHQALDEMAAENQRLGLYDDAVNITQDRVDETAKGEHEPVCFLRETNWSYEIAPWDDPNGIPVYTAPPKREWVGLTHEERDDIDQAYQSRMQALFAIEAKLKEKNA